MTLTRVTLRRCETLFFGMCLFVEKYWDVPLEVRPTYKWGISIGVIIIGVITCYNLFTNLLLTSWDIQVLEYRKGFLVNKATFLDNFKVNTKKTIANQVRLVRLVGFLLYEP